MEEEDGVKIDKEREDEEEAPIRGTNEEKDLRLFSVSLGLNYKMIISMCLATLLCCGFSSLPLLSSLFGTTHIDQTSRGTP